MNAQISILDEIIVDNFAGGGGASTGIELATGRPVTIAINHDPAAILMHRTNHPYTLHLQASVWDVDPEEVCAGRPVGLAWFSPDCKHFSKAKGAALVDRNIRGLAWVALRWAGTVRPRVIILENVEEFTTWGPVRKGKPVKSKSGQTFHKWLTQLRDLGYQVEYRELVAADYGAPTSRKRFVLIARCDGRPITWPERTHAPADSAEVKSGKCLPWRSAAEIIDWSIPMYSIFDSKEQIREKYGVMAVRPLADNTMRRIICGVDKYTIRSGNPFIIECNHSGGGHTAPKSAPLGTITQRCTKGICAANFIQYHTEQTERVRANGLDTPLPTVDASNRYGLTTAHLTEYYGNGNPLDLREPMHTITARDREALTAVHVVEFKGQNIGQAADAPLRTITAGGGEFAACGVQIEHYDPTRTELGYWPEIRRLLNRHCGYQLADDEVLLMKLRGNWYYIRDISLRMLSPRELYAAMGFPPDYIIDRDYTGRAYPKSAQVARCGNAVCPPMASAVVRANFPEWAVKLDSMEELERMIAV